ncbi:cytochrome c biogenesis protein ResB [Roseateles oligotrophus]|uniref:Cytochrome c biogenesis protein ResB n=1 Tax=Roseateles oligotrophus TaxID=1769250 RepID=A0ABT2YEC6_9BURK|nr:cytochrome c biogenesis protein ResB [Roseateles oligotrophus]MCV2368403.1 cytochrome c biogenesis protein ResB [Roseateles oligotrophus]
MSESPSSPPARPRNSVASEALDLLSSMRFAIALLTVICIASTIGTVVKQREPLSNYVNQFGPFWADVFGKFDLYTVYGAWWFLLILAFLVISTSLCIARNAPKIIHDLKNFKEHVREQSLQSFHHKALGHIAIGPEVALSQVSAYLANNGWKTRVQARERGVMVAARKGATNKIGYLAAHSSIVLICLGGLLDGDLLVRALMWAQNKTIYQGGGLISEVKPEHRLPTSNPSFRGNLMVPEGGRAATAILSMPNGVVLQDLPFDVELQKFIVEYYDTGMPKLFASEISIRDHETGAVTQALVKVNEPAFHRGIAIYQSSFEDGGSDLKLLAQPMGKAGAGGGGNSNKPFIIEGRVGGSTELKSEAQSLKLEFAGLRVINVENLGGSPSANGGTDVRKVDLVNSLQSHMGSGAKTRTDKELRNVGPSFSYRLRDASGQAREFNNYMAPVELDGQRVFLAGVRESASEAFRYLRIPADEKMSMDGWLQLRQALLDPAERERAAKRYAEAATPADKPQMTPQLQATARRALGLFAGAEGVKPGAEGSTAMPGGLPALSQFIESEVPEAERQRVSEVLLRILNGSLFELYKQSRQQAGLDAPASDAATQTFMTQSVLALSDSMFYPAPVLLQLDEFKQVQASVFQVTRAPGQKLVYLGAILLIIGVFAMLYIKERRLWLWLEAAPGQGEATRIRMALSSSRETPDTATEFAQLKQDILKDSV